uniref:Uncharacterized protein n=1 Tax=Ursus maritimus TaxID=29073 RepID=A0A452UN99_URSMA
MGPGAPAGPARVRLSALSYVGIALTLSGMFLYHNCEFVASWAVRRGFWRRGRTGKGL